MRRSCIRLSSGGVARRFMTTSSSGKQREMPMAPVTLVTGSSRGIGKEIALELARSGCRVVVNYTRPESAEDAAAAVEEIRAIDATGKSATVAMAVQCDVRDPASVKQMLATISAEPSFGPVSILVNNAGITRDKLVARMMPHDFTDVVDVNLSGTFHVSQAAVAGGMLKQKWGRIVNISSIAGQLGNAGQANYAASKAGMIGLTRSMAKELGSRGITVNACCPGYIDTDMTTDIQNSKVNSEALLSNVPLGRFGTASEVAGMVRFLVMDGAAAYITGHCFNVDGGMGIGAT